MAEFAEVIEKKEKMCECYDYCDKCPLSSCNNHEKMSCVYYIIEHPKEAEKIIMEWEESVDWSKVEVDTPILVKHYEDENWVKRHFAKYEYGDVFAWIDGITSWSANDDERNIVNWEYAKLAEVKE